MLNASLGGELRDDEQGASCFAIFRSSSILLISFDNRPCVSVLIDDIFSSFFAPCFASQMDTTTTLTMTSIRRASRSTKNYRGRREGRGVLDRSGLKSFLLMMAGVVGP